MASTQLLAILKYLMRIALPSALVGKCIFTLNCIHRQEIYVRKSHSNYKEETAVEKTDDALETQEDAEKIISEETQGEDAESDEPSKVGIWIKFEDKAVMGHIFT